MSQRQGRREILCFDSQISTNKHELAQISTHKHDRLQELVQKPGGWCERLQEPASQGGRGEPEAGEKRKIMF